MKAMAASTAPGPIERGIVIGHLGIIAVRKTIRTCSREDFGGTLRLYKTGPEALPPHHESRCDILGNIVDFLQAQAILEADAGRDRAIENLMDLIHYTALLIEVLPDCSTKHPTLLLNYANYLHESVA